MAERCCLRICSSCDERSLIGVWMPDPGCRIPDSRSEFEEVVEGLAGARWLLRVLGLRGGGFALPRRARCKVRARICGVFRRHASGNRLRAFEPRARIEVQRLQTGTQLVLALRALAERENLTVDDSAAARAAGDGARIHHPRITCALRRD